jgi:hypothetical protein
MTEYEPGACNIGEAEQRKRYALGAVAFAATLGLVMGVYLTDAPVWLLVLTAGPLFFAAEGFFQGRYEFCVGFAALGIYDVSEDGGNRKQVDSAADRRADRERAREIHQYSAVTTAAGTALIVVVGLLVA